MMMSSPSMSPTPLTIRALDSTYTGALSQVRDQTVQIKPSRNAPEGNEVIVRTEVRGKGDPVQLDYRVEKSNSSWKIYDVNVLGVWLVENYRNSFAQEIGARYCVAMNSCGGAMFVALKAAGVKPGDACAVLSDSPVDR